MSTYNATCQLTAHRRLLEGTGNLTRGHRWQELPEQRASLRPMSVSRAVAAFGEGTVGMWTLRVFYRERPQSGWQVNACLDGEDTWYEYRVVDVTRAGAGMAWRMTVQRA